MDPLAEAPSSEPAAPEPPEEEEPAEERPSQLISSAQPAEAPTVPVPLDAPGTPSRNSTMTLPGGEVADVALGDDPLVSSIMSSNSFDELMTNLNAVSAWEFVRARAARPPIHSKHSVNPKKK